MALVSVLAFLVVAGAVQAATQEADYVIVGGGTAGCALAARLCSGLPNKKFTLLERGKPRTPEQDLLVDSVRNAFYAWDDPGLVETWNSSAVPGMNGRKLELRTGGQRFAGNTLGGCSSINGAHWTEPSPRNAASWGFAGLDKKTAKRLFKKAARQVKPAMPPKSLRQTYLPQWFVAAKKAGIKILPGPKTPLGLARDAAWLLEMAATKNGVRRNSCRAYLEPVMGKGKKCAKNLKLVQDATVSKVRTKGGKATAVEWYKGQKGTVNTVTANKEVILSAGPFGSAKVLQLSGIGPSKVLQSQGIQVVKDLPVGDNLQMTPFSLVTYIYPGKPLARENDRSIVKSEAAKKQFLAGKGGVLGVGITQIDGTLREANSIISSQTANLQPYDNEKQLVSGCFINPISRGTMSAASADLYAPPSVSPNHFSKQSEAEDALKCLKRHMQIMDNYPKSFQLQLVYPPTPVDTDAVRETSSDGNHSVGACAVGKVINGNMKVKGFSNLRVVDSSALPAIPRWSGPMSSVYMLAEHAAELIIDGK